MDFEVKKVRAVLVSFRPAGSFDYTVCKIRKLLRSG